MGKILSAKGSGYFPLCIPTGVPDTANTIKLTLQEAMTLFWRVKKFEGKINGTINYPAGPNSGAYTITYTMNAYAEMPNFGNFYPTPNTEEDIVCDTNEGRRAFYAPDAITVFFSFQQNPLLLPIFMFYSFNSDSGAVKESDNSFFYPDFTAQFHVLDTRNIGKSYVGDCNLSFYGYNKNLPLYANQGGDPSSFNISASIRAKEYFSYGGTYDTATGNPL